MRDLLVKLIEDFSLGHRRRWMRLAQAQGAQPVGGARERIGKSPANKKQSERGDQKRLYERVQERIAQRAGDLSFNVAGVMKYNQCAGHFTVAVQGQRENVERGVRNAQEFAGTALQLNSAGGRGGTCAEVRRKARGDRERRSFRVINSDSLQMFALTETLDQPLHILVGAAIEERLDGFLKALRKNLRAAGEIVAQDAPFRAHLVGGEEQRHEGHTHNQRHNHFQARAHREASFRKT